MLMRPLRPETKPPNEHPEPSARAFGEPSAGKGPERKVGAESEGEKRGSLLFSVFRMWRNLFSDGSARAFGF